MQNIQLRKLYASLLFGVVVFWMLVIMYVVLSTASSCHLQNNCRCTTWAAKAGVVEWASLQKP